MIIPACGKGGIITKGHLKNKSLQKPQHNGLALIL